MALWFVIPKLALQFVRQMGEPPSPVSLSVEDLIFLLERIRALL